MSESVSYRELCLAAAKALVGEANADFAVYLPPCMGQEPVLYRERASGLSTPDFERLEANGVNRIYVLQDDLNKCLRVLEDKLDEYLFNPDVPAEEKAGVIHGVGVSLAEDLITARESGPELSRTHAFLESITRGFLNDSAVAGHMLGVVQSDRSIASHMLTVSAYAIMLGYEAFGDEPEMLGNLALSGMLHDLGKLSIPPEVLGKNTRLDRGEIEMIRQHPIESVRLIGDDPGVSMIARQAILQHHERVDGRGYPTGVCGNDLIPEARILAIVDSFDALIGRQAYQRILTVPEALRMVEMQAGQQFDEELVECWSSLFGRHWAVEAERLGHQAEGAGEAVPSRREHSALPIPKESLAEGERLAFPRNALVKCFYAGRLPNAAKALDEFLATLSGLSHNGFSVLTPHAMYRGEVLHARMRKAGSEILVRGTVAWCRQNNQHVYETSIQSLERLPDSDALKRTPVKGMLELADSQTKSREKPRASAPKGIRHDEVASARQSAIHSLDEFARSPRLTPEKETTVVSLAMSGDPQVRLKAISVLAAIRTPMARETLTYMLSDPDPSVREHAVVAVGSLEVIEAAEMVRQLLCDSNEAVAAQAKDVLSKLNSRK